MGSMKSVQPWAASVPALRGSRFAEARRLIQEIINAEGQNELYTGERLSKLCDLLTATPELAASGMWGATKRLLANAAGLNASTVDLRIARYRGNDYNSNRTVLFNRTVRLPESQAPSEDWPPPVEGEYSEVTEAAPTDVDDWPPRERVVEEDAPIVNAAAPLREVFSVAEWTALDAAQRADLIAAGHEGRAGLNEQKSNSIEWALWTFARSAPRGP